MLKDIIPKNRKRLFLIVILLFLFYTIDGLLNFTQIITHNLAIEQPIKYRFEFIMEMTGSYMHFLLLPFILLFISRFQIKHKNLLSYIPLHLFASMFFGACHTLLMYISRTIIFWMFDLGEYNYGIIIYRFPMEYTHQIFSYWFLYIIVQAYNLFRKHQEHKFKTINLEKQLIKAQLQALQMQVHPHFLFNTLNMISSVMYEDTKTADKMIANLSDLLRVTLNSKEIEEHKLKKELEITNFYVEIMRARFSDKLNINFDIDSGTNNALVPGFILQPLIENSIKYSMEDIGFKVEISVSTIRESDNLRLVVSDNGPGIQANFTELKKEGIGLSNIEERLEKLYNSNYKFQLYNKNQGGLEVLIEIPFKH